MTVVRVVQMAIDEVVDMIPMWDGLVTAAFAVLMGGLVAFARVSGRTFGGIRLRHLYAALVEVIAVSCVQAAVVQIIDVVFVADGHVTTVFTMDVGVVAVDLVRGQRIPPTSLCAKWT